MKAPESTLKPLWQLWAMVALASWALLLSAAGSTSLLAQTAAGAARGEAIEFKGPILAIDRTATGHPSAITIKVNASQIQVQLNDWTRVTQGRGFQLTVDDLALEAFIEVKGFFTAGGKIVAQRIQVEGRDALDLEGPIQSISSPTVRVNGIDCRLTETSIIRKAGEATPRSATDLQVGLLVRLRAGWNDNRFVILELEYGARTVESEPIRFEGTLVKQEGQILSIDVGITQVDALVAFDLSTQVEGALVPGSLVEIEGRFVPGTSLVKAVRIAVDSNGNGNLYDDEADDSASTGVEAEVEGRIAGLIRDNTGAVQRFSINETRVTLTSQTQVVLDSGAPSSASLLQEGLKVEVKGTRTTDGGVLASRIKVKTEEGSSDSAASTDAVDSLPVADESATLFPSDR